MHCKFFHGKFYRFCLCNFSHYSPTMIFTVKDYKSNYFKIYEKSIRNRFRDPPEVGSEKMFKNGRFGNDFRPCFGTPNRFKMRTSRNHILPLVTTLGPHWRGLKIDVFRQHFVELSCDSCC